jgi:hypothetical protein
LKSAHRKPVLAFGDVDGMRESRSDLMSSRDLPGEVIDYAASGAE